MEFQEFAFWLLCGTLAMLVGIVAWFLQTLLGEIKGVRIEMVDLNQTLVKVVTNQDWHGKEIERLNGRVEKLEHVRDANLT
jgi:hypothetical protein